MHDGRTLRPGAAPGQFLAILGLRAPAPTRYLPRTVRTFPPEDLARALHRRLRSAFWLHRPRVDVDLVGDGATWSCHAASPDRRCETACLDAGGAEFLTSFHGDEPSPSWGRTTSRSDTIDVVRLWLGGATLGELARRHPFVDARRRTLAEIQRVVLADARIAAGVAARLVHESGDTHHLRFAAGDRAIRLSFYARNPHPDAFLLWDDCPLVQTTVLYPPTFAVIVHRWLVDRSAPSEMHADFPWLLLHPEAPYYEEGRPIEGEFIVSWDRVEDRYAEHGRGAAPILSLLAALRSAGLAERLRAGTSNDALLLSRARRHGLRPEQPFVALRFRQGTLRADAPFAGVADREHPLTASPELLGLLQELAALPID